uniref:Uncharacterized protein n=1 Tax=Streptomyces sp. 44030 TaxID=364102 RepID=Q2LEX4_9ACTN|nr:hypothetical protein [Streptomyces sp. 44030]ABC67341.1 hypothetical protein pRL1.12 [Streptomyces sp. 44030]
MLTVTLPDGRSAFARGVVDGLPAFGWGSAPAGLLTRRQLAAERLRPVGDPVALIIWGRARSDGRPARWAARPAGPPGPPGPLGRPARWAALFPVDQAADKRPCTPGMRAAIGAALAARRVCQLCGPIDHYTRSGLCSACFVIAGPTKPSTAA